ncbi:NAD-dependent epimerase/dehydratase family protein [Alkalilacustris brevis]|uniref:NAD-dependent epimerase/dehydratase family protein n=1 Tax=Alkalilacustris brevis TaxID=2026338 RepID=UPI000E0DB9B8|nr:NAD-dependent epimerase/dehydratase family protein [Alkalilacustris brevis]
MKILVTGCGGFIGSHLLDRLLAREGVSIIGWDPDCKRISHLLDHPALSFRQERLGGPESLARLEQDVADCDWVFNLSAICHPSRYNTEALRTIHVNLFEAYPVIELAARLGRKLVHFSTSEVYGKTIASYLGGYDDVDPALYMMNAENSPLIMGPVRNQRWSYACAKQMLERLVYAHHHESGLQFAIIRPFNFFGPRMDYLPGIESEGVPRVLPMFISAVLRGIPIQLVDGGHARRTITSVHDAIDALMAILDQPQRSLNHIYNIGNPRNEVSMRELAEAVRQTFVRVSGETRFARHPIEIVSSMDFYGPGYEDCDRRIMDISAERNQLGWSPSRELESLLDETVAYYWRLYGASS